MHDTFARSGPRLAVLATVLAMLVVLVVVSAPAFGHEAHSDSGGTGGDTPTQREGGGADGRTDKRHTGTADGEGAADVPSPTPAYMVIPAAGWGAVITIGGWVLLWRRTDTG